jgi:hypothetical protein
MNVDIPIFEESDSAKFLGRYTTFIIIVAGSAAAALGMFAYFHRIRWV